MIARQLKFLRLHEWAFGLFLLITSCRLLVASGFSQAAVFVVMAATIPLMAALEFR